ncbi:alpha/beta hydrolase fold domain-containing protein [Microbacterium sp. MTN4-26]|uniref:alpha/beta hydrolase fold domain-containing protein n=1 Tax=unclassified Microbacterium TaxID=2609290 RepID=UPI0036F2D7CB
MGARHSGAHRPARAALGRLPRPAAAREPLASPIRAASHRGLPPAVILTAEYDPLRGHGDAYGAALRRDGVAASVVQYRGGTHDTALFTGALPLARRWHDDVVAALRSLHTLEPPSG